MAQGVVISGPVFEKGGRITDKQTAQFVQRLVELGEQRLDEVLRPQPSGVYIAISEGGKSTGNYRRNVSGRVDKLTGIIDDGGVVYGAWLEGTSSRNQRSRFKGYASFRKTQKWLNDQVKEEAEKFVYELARKLNGV